MSEKKEPAANAVSDFSTVDISKLHYLAGVIDSDGCITINKFYDPKHPNRSPRYVLSIIVVNTSIRLMNWLADNFGGTFKERKKISEHHKTTYHWQFTNSKAAHLLALIKPYLVEKFDRAANAIDFIEGGDRFTPRGSTALSEEELARREAHYQVGKMLNQSGIVQPQRLNSKAPTGLSDDAIV